MVRITARIAVFVLALAGVVRAEGGDGGGEGAPPSPSDEQVLESIQKGIDFLLKDMNTRLEPARHVSENGLSDPTLLHGEIGSGEFTLEAYALLHAGRDLNDPRLHFRDDHMSLAVNVLEHEEIDYTYTTALQALALAELPQLPEVKKALSRASLRLVAATGGAGGYTYQVNSPARTSHDQSNSQYGLLGVWAAADWGIDVPPRYWKDTDDFWRTIQNPDGGWAYGMGSGSGEPSKPSMTAAGAASLFVCQEFLDRTPTLIPSDDTAMDHGLGALIQGFDPGSNDLYYLYGVERVGLASGMKYLGRQNWYRAVAANVLKMQQPDGSFSSSYGPVVNTSYAILFLTRGRAPVPINKLQYNGPWNARPRDAANVIAYLAKTLEKHLNWQSVPLDVPYEEWLDAPLLLITGSKDPGFTDDDIAKLRQFVNAGGIIISVADGNSQEFSDAMKRYATRLRPDPQAWRQLPPDHPLFTVYTHPKQTPELYGLTNGVRELWIHCPHDYGAAWQLRDYKSQLHEAAWGLPAQLLFYAAGKGQLRSKLESLLVPPPPQPPEHHITMAQLEYTGNWNPEPGAWPRFARILALQANTELFIENIKASELGTLAEKPAIVHLAGTGKLNLTDDEQQALKVYVLAGGTLFVEAMGGDEDFKTSAAEMLAKLFPEAKLKTIPANYLLYTGDNGTYSAGMLPIDHVDYRKYWILTNGALTKPRLKYMTLEHRVGVIFSEEDITSGLLGTNTWGIGGYEPASAVQLARNIILFADLNMPHLAETQPTENGK